ncbi:MAG: tRNA pseudouridine(38-40) synthase TruA, partial [Candidatus Binatia bacterium]
MVCGRPPSPMLADRSWHVYPDLDESLLQELADMVVGTHDFAAFRSADCDSSSTERQILSSRWRRDGHVLVYEVSGNAFLKQMVRVLVGSMVDVALGDLEKNDFAALFDHGDRRRAGRTAPAKGL